MKLTVERDRAKLERYRHIESVSAWSGERCGAQCPGTLRVCTRKRRHGGPHVAHNLFGKLVAAWDEKGGVEVARPLPDSVGRRRRPESPLRIIASYFPRSAEEYFLLVLFLGMVGFVLEWFFILLG